jgi:hypothetical protein
MTTQLQRVDEIISRFAREVMSFPVVKHACGPFRAHYSAGIVVSMVSDVHLDILVGTGWSRLRIGTGGGHL